MSDLTIALAGGVVGSVATAVGAQAARARAAWSEVALHDAEAEERNAQLVVWVDDRTRVPLIEMDTITNDYAGRAMLYSGVHGGGLAQAKADALHEYRDEEWRARNRPRAPTPPARARGTGSGDGFATGRLRRWSLALRWSLSYSGGVRR